MGWTAYITVYALPGLDLEPAKRIAHEECSHFLILPGSEGLDIGFDKHLLPKAVAWIDEDIEYPGYEQVGFGFCKIQSSINPLLSLTSAMYVAKEMAKRLGDDFVIEFSHDYGERKEANTFSNVQLFLSEIRALLLTPAFLFIKLFIR